MAFLSHRWVLLLLAFNFSFSIDSVLAQDYTDPRKDIDRVDDEWFSFLTRPDIQAPRFDVRVYDEDAISPGYWFFAPYEDHSRFQRGKPFVGPFIYDGNGSLIWSGAPFVDRFKVWDFRVSEYGGEDMLTGVSHRENAGMIINHNYEFVREVTWEREFANTNAHEFNVVENGTRALVLTAFQHVKLSREKSMTQGYEGNCEVEHHGIMELDITVDPPKKLFEWIGMDHISLDETTQRPSNISHLCTNDWDIHHFNSLDKFPDGDYLLSARHTSGIYKISHVDGSIVWRFGGTLSDFDIPPELVFSRQHHPRIHLQNATHIIISFFDNAEGWDHEPTNTYSRGLLVALQPEVGKAELLAEAPHPLRETSDARGSTQILPNGNFFVGWSKHIRMSEHSPDGRLLLHVNPKHNLGTYRSYKFPWVGEPKYPPNVYSAAFVGGTPGVRNPRLITKVAVSWNGATEVRSWKFYKTKAKDTEGKHLEFIQEVDRTGFETLLHYNGYAECVAVEAIDARGQIIGRSDVTHTLVPVEEGTEMNETTIASYIADDWSRFWISTLINPFSTFVAGFVACAVIWYVLRFMRKPRARPWWRPHMANMGKYAALGGWKQGSWKQDASLLRHSASEDSDEDEAAMELRDKNYT